jgi:hypothetical protein
MDIVLLCRCSAGEAVSLKRGTNGLGAYNVMQDQQNGCKLQKNDLNQNAYCMISFSCFTPETE